MKCKKCVCVNAYMRNHLNLNFPYFEDFFLQSIFCHGVVLIWFFFFLLKVSWVKMVSMTASDSQFTLMKASAYNGRMSTHCDVTLVLNDQRKKTAAALCWQPLNYRAAVPGSITEDLLASRAREMLFTVNLLRL